MSCAFFKPYNRFQWHLKCNLIRYFGLQDPEWYGTCLSVNSHFLTPLPLASEFSPLAFFSLLMHIKISPALGCGSHYFLSRKIHPPPQKKALHGFLSFRNYSVDFSVFYIAPLSKHYLGHFVPLAYLATYFSFLKILNTLIKSTKLYHQVFV